MRPIKPSTASQPAAADPRLTQANADTDERDRPPEIRSLITPGVASGPILPEWLRKRFRRKETPAAR
jgi:hypothetical protein